MMAGSKTLPSKGRIQMSQTNYLQIVKSGLQRTAGPYRCAIHEQTHRTKWHVNGKDPGTMSRGFVFISEAIDQTAIAAIQAFREGKPQRSRTIGHQR